MLNRSPKGANWAIALRRVAAEVIATILASHRQSPHMVIDLRPSVKVMIPWDKPSGIQANPLKSAVSVRGEGSKIKKCG